MEELLKIAKEIGAKVEDKGAQCNFWGLIHRLNEVLIDIGAFQASTEGITLDESKVEIIKADPLDKLPALRSADEELARLFADNPNLKHRKEE